MGTKKRNNKINTNNVFISMKHKVKHNLRHAAIPDNPKRFIDQNNIDKKTYHFYAWQPITWPNAPDKFNNSFYQTIKRIFDECIIQEIENVLYDIKKCSHEGLQHRGHVVAIALLSAVDAISSYAYSEPSEKCPICGLGDSVGPRYKKFIKIHFPGDYKPYAHTIYKLYRNSLIHSWNLFEAGMSPGEESIKTIKGTVSFGLLNFYEAIRFGLNDFLTKLEKDVALQKATLKRYKALKATAK